MNLIVLILELYYWGHLTRLTLVGGDQHRLRSVIIQESNLADIFNAHWI